MVLKQKIIEPLLNRAPAPCIKNENRDITAMRNIFKSNGNVTKKAEQFYKENTLEDTMA